jgi:hypothetical protein
MKTVSEIFAEHFSLSSSSSLFFTRAEDMIRAAQEEMREECAVEVEQWGFSTLAAMIRAIEVKGR